MKRFFAALVTVAILSPLPVSSAVVGDINQDGKIDITEAVYALQVSSGVYPSLDPSCLLVGIGTWGVGADYIECDVVDFNGVTYACTSQHRSEAGAIDPTNADYWTVLSIKGDTGDVGPQGPPGVDGVSGTSEWTDASGLVTTSSNVGIGTDTPNAKLHVLSSPVNSYGNWLPYDAYYNPCIYCTDTCNGDSSSEYFCLDGQVVECVDINNVINDSWDYRIVQCGQSIPAANFEGRVDVTGTLAVTDLTINGLDADQLYLNSSGDTMSTTSTDAVLTIANAGTGDGIVSQTASGAAAAVRGNATNSEYSINYGGYFNSSGAKGVGVFGEATGVLGVGVHGKSLSPTGAAALFEGSSVLKGDLIVHGQISGTGTGSGSGLDADLLDGQHASDLIDAASDEVRTVITSLPYTITAAGSYILASNMYVSDPSANGITIYDKIPPNYGEGITIDLMGFTIRGPGTGTGHGIFSGTGINITIRNGNVESFGGTAIYERNQNGGSANYLVDGITAFANDGGGSTSVGKGMSLKIAIFIQADMALL